MLKSKSTGTIVRTKTANWDAEALEWLIDSGILADPEQDYEYIKDAPTVSTVDFRNLFSIAEEIAITTSTDPVVKVLWDRFIDPKLNNVDLSLASVDSALDYLTSVDILAAGRKEEILTGQAI